ncbi:hypothetical protein DASB73_025770 [Starmerella bacillaris]|uniref:Uncharacterized protein n=1 Tax=Starmerella bacillaris TaxID=1247836 RepID=A0AAV5RJ83_STABA|nr:hypothetical protein DASB73_025770 [Starmerella bacillaris]
MEIKENEQKSMLLKDVLAYSRGDDANSLMHALMRQAVVEIVGVSPHKFYRRLQDYVDDGLIRTMRKARAYSVSRLEHVAKTNRTEVDKAQYQRTVDAFNQLRDQILIKAQEQCPVIQNYIIANTFSVNFSIYSEGYFRGPANEGVSYYNIDETANLPKEIEQQENQLRKHIIDAKSTKEEISIADKSIERLLQLERWLDEVLVEDFKTSLDDIMKLRNEIKTIAMK